MKQVVKFIIKSIIFTLPIYIPILVYLCVISPNLSGDMGFRGYIMFPKDYAIFSTPCNNMVIKCKQNDQKFCTDDILTIGDSFSQTDNIVVSYNYYLAQQTENSLYNFEQHWYNNPFARFLHLSKTTVLPKIVVVETAERRLIDRLQQISINHSKDDLSSILNDTISEYNAQPMTCLEKTQEWTKRSVGFWGYENPVKQATLIQNYFTCSKHKNMLYFFVEDIRNISNNNVIDEITLKLDSLYSYASSIGVDLYVLIAADKYDVYQSFIKDNEYPVQNLLDTLCEIYPNDYLINSKDTLLKMLSIGVQDVYWCNNSHWSPVGAEAVAVQVAKVINKTQGKEIFIVD